MGDDNADGEIVARAKTSAALAKQACVCPDPRTVKVHPATTYAASVKRPLDGLNVSLDAAAAPARRRQQQRCRGHTRPPELMPDQSRDVTGSLRVGIKLSSVNSVPFSVPP